MVTAKRVANRPVVICKKGEKEGRTKPIVKYTVARKTYFIWCNIQVVVKSKMYRLQPETPRQCS